ncbi:MAG TPA: YciK family oxidoreductase [Methylophilaceae bacterium]|nr:YciK family oxidoreductase [Methylophilaceae bacterium]
MNNYQAPPTLLTGRVILVTGAGQGVGRAAALTFAEKGATVILLGRKVEKLEAVYDEIAASGYAEALIFPMDLALATEQDFANMAEGIYQQLGRLDGILHNAAHFENLSPLEIQSMAQFEQMLRVNLIAPFALTKACLPLLQRSADASVIFTSTTAGHTPMAYWGSHGISKHAAEYMAQAWGQELEKMVNLRINTVVPGAVQSPQRKKSHPGEVHSSLPTTESILPLYLYLMGPDSKGISGQVFEANK